MRKKAYNKLVRDGIPAVLENRKLTHKIRVLKPKQLIKALKIKLGEEAAEVLKARTRQALIEELADVREVLEALAAHIEIKPGEVEAACKKKRQARGGFDQGIFLEWVQE